MKSIMRSRPGSIMTCILEIIVGILLFINPVDFTSGIIIGAGVLMCLGGVVCGVQYFLVKTEVAAQKQLLFKGLVLLMAGVACITKHEWFLTAFPLLTVLYAIWMLLLAAMKLQQMADMKRAALPRWYMPGIASLVAAVLAAVILLNPFGAANAVWIFVGVSLIAEAAVELAGIMIR